MFYFIPVDSSTDLFDPLKHKIISHLFQQKEKWEFSFRFYVSPISQRQLYHVTQEGNETFVEIKQQKPYLESVLVKTKEFDVILGKLKNIWTLRQSSKLEYVFVKLISRGIDLFEKWINLKFPWE